MRKRMSPFFAAVFFGLLFLCAASIIFAQEPYYKGKTVRFVVNFSAGGPTDVFGRLIARYIPHMTATCGCPEHGRCRRRHRSQLCLRGSPADGLTLALRRVPPQFLAARRAMISKTCRLSRGGRDPRGIRRAIPR
jgi:hypothetical protein